MKRIFIRRALAAAIVVISLTGSAAHASERTVDVSGAWQELGGACVVDNVDASNNTAHLTCTGAATAEGLDRGLQGAGLGHPGTDDWQHLGHEHAGVHRPLGRRRRRDDHHERGLHD
jgi:hypothetical protein